MIEPAAEFFEMSLDNLCVAGFDGYIKRVNPSWTRTLGWTADELMSRPSIEFVHPDDRAATLAARGGLTVGTPLRNLVNRYLHKDGSYRWFEWRSVSRVDLGLVYAAARDITEQKLADERLREARELQGRLQRQLIFADRMASVGTLAAGVAHEINNPLAYVLANVSILAEELQNHRGIDPSQRDEWLGIVRDALTGAERIQKIVRGLKTFSRAEEERRTVIDVTKVIDLSIDMTFNEIRHRARLVKDYGKIPRVEADDARLGQVFINLLVNAAQAIAEGDSAANEIRVVTATDERGRAVIEVRDTGCGIDPAAIGRVFDPFFTTKPVGLGTGLGLSICHNIVSALGGEITASSEKGRGTAFRVVLPAATTAPPDAERPASAPDVALACASILVVDDEPAVGNVFRRILRDHEVTFFTSARDALAVLDTGKKFDVVFSDLMMPEMSGIEFYDELARRFPAAIERLVFVSGGAFTPSASAFFDRVDTERLPKPFVAQDVRDIVKRLLALRAR